MSRRRAIGLLAAGGIGLAGLQQTGAFDAVVGDRPFRVGTAGDDEAMVGLDVQTVEGEDGDRVDVVTLTNSGAEDFTEVTVRLVGTQTNPSLSNFETPMRLDVNQDALVTAELSCDESVDDVPVPIEIIVGGESTGVELERDVSVTCDAPTPFDPFDCHAVWHDGLDHCDYHEGNNLELEDGAGRDGNVCMASSDDVDVELEDGGYIGGFLRVEAGDEVDLVLEDSSYIDGVVVIKACGDVDIDMDDGIIYGDLCIKAGEDVDVEIEDGSVIHGDMKIDAQDDVDIDIDGGEVKGDIDENWDSGWEDAC